MAEANADVVEQSRRPRFGSISLRALRERFVLVVALIGLLYGLDWTYVNVLVRLYGEYGIPGYPFAQRGVWFLVFCWTIALIPATWMPLTVRRPSHVLTWCVYLMTLLPTVVVGVYTRIPTPEAIAMLLISLAGFAVLCAQWKLPTFRVPGIRADSTVFWVGIIGFSALAYGVTLITFGPHMRFVGLGEVYEQRTVARELGASTLAFYMVSWQGSAVNPLLMAVGISHRRPLIFLAGVAGELFLFGVAAQRMLLAAPAIVLGLHFFLRSGGRNFGLRATIASILAFTMPVIAFGTDRFFVITKLVFDALLNRLFLNNGFISQLYFQYFANHPQVGFAQVKPFSFFLRSPYKVGYPEALAWDVWGRYSDPNANLFGDGFAQAGYPGVLIECAVLAVAFWIIDGIAKRHGLSVWFVAMACASQVTIIANASPSNIIFGEGFGFVMVMLYLWPKSEPVTVREPVASRARPGIRLVQGELQTQ